MDRSEHMAWCKKRALEYVDMGDNEQAVASMMSDLRKHELTSNHPAIRLGWMLNVAGKLSTTDEMRRFIEGFN